MWKLMTLAAPLALLAPLAAIAADIEAAADAGIGYSDNIARNEVDQRHESIAQAGVQLTAQQNTRRLSLDVAADVAYQDYLRNTYEGEVIGSIDAAAVLRIVPDRIHWSFDDNFGQARRDLFLAVTPDNRENVNNFSTGPDVLVRLGEQGQLRFAGRYGRVDYEDSPLDSERYSGSVAVLRYLSKATVLSVNAQTARVEYAQTPPNLPFDRHAAYVRYAVEGGRTQLSLDAGLNRTERAGITNDGTLLRLELTREVGRAATLRLTAGSELTDAGATLGASLGQGIISDAQSIATTGEPFTNRYVTVAWDATGRRTRMGLSASFFRESHEQGINQDRDRIEGQIYVARDFSAGWTVRLAGTHKREDFRNLDTDYQETAGVAGLSRQLTRRLYIELSAERYGRNTSTGSGEYTENRGWLRLRFGDRLARNAGLPALLPRRVLETEPSL